VILKNRNHTEVKNLVQFAIDHEIDISFIEEMPLGLISEHLRAESYYSSPLIKADLENHFSLVPSIETTGGPANYFTIPATKTRVGFISPHSANFCASCNRVRLTAEGRLLLCLGNDHAVDLKQIIRNNPNDSLYLKQAIINALLIKPEKHEFNLHEQPIILRYMNATGG
jgi:cyclic pyranopterin phosphate synthase